jgi:hypothetical protein
VANGCSSERPDPVRADAHLHVASHLRSGGRVGHQDQRDRDRG